MSYLKRYQAGQYEQVWAELVTLGGQVREPAILPDAQAVARETMTRVATNIDRIIEALQTLNYRFSPPEEPRRKPAPNVEEALDHLEAEIGVLPLALRAWYECVGSVDFIGHFPRWLNDPHYQPPEPGEIASETERELSPLPWPAQGFSPYTDALMVFPFEELQERNLWHPGPHGPARHQATSLAEIGDWYKESYMEIGVDFVHKAGFSGGQFYSMQVPDASADGIILALPTCYWEAPPWGNTMWIIYETTRPVRFVEYLRICCRWGGFPGFGAEYAALPPALQRLTADLLPF
jgi:hypothetical protein